MNRRKFVQAAGLSGLLTCLPGKTLAFAEEKKTSPRATSVDTDIFRLKLRHTWTTTMSSSTYRDVLYVHYNHDGITGVGEGAPIVRYKEDAKGARDAVDSVLPMLNSSDPTQFEKVISEVFARVPGQWAGKAAIDIALMDWMGEETRRSAVSVFRTGPERCAGDRFFHRDRHSCDYTGEGEGSGGVSDFENQGGVGHGRADDCGGAQCDR